MGWETVEVTEQHTIHDPNFPPRTVERKMNLFICPVCSSPTKDRAAHERWHHTLITTGDCTSTEIRICCKCQHEHECSDVADNEWMCTWCISSDYNNDPYVVCAPFELRME